MSSSGLPYRANYCAHPAHIESFGIEEYLGQTQIGVASENRECIVKKDSTVEGLLARLHPSWAHVVLKGPRLSPLSLLNANAKEDARG